MDTRQTLWGKEYRKTPTGKYVKYRREAKYRHVRFGLTLKQFMLFWKQDCYYCGDKIKTIGLDRVNSNIGYVLHNVVPCCVQCNTMKWNYSKQKFLNHCKKILKHTWKRKN